LGACGEKVGLHPFPMMAMIVFRCVINLSMLALCRLPPPPPPPPSLAVATPVVAATRELQELLLVREEELT
jgi:hypothetical protein